MFTSQSTVVMDTKVAAVLFRFRCSHLYVLSEYKYYSIFETFCFAPRMEKLFKYCITVLSTERDMSNKCLL